MAEGVYDVLDENGKVIKTLIAPKGGSLRSDLEAGKEVYKPNRAGEEEYISTSEAKASISIDPKKGRITVDGPKWLTNQIVNSESFKKNYSENSSLLGLVNLYRSDRASTVTDPTTGDPIKVSDAIKVFQESATNYGETFVPIANYKSDIKKKYGANLADKDIYIANNFYNKADYDKNGAIYIPRWAMDKYDWSSLESWDEDNRTISTADFFENVFKNDFNSDIANKLQKTAESSRLGFTDYNSYDRSDSKEAEARKKNIESSDYAEELARTIQMYNIVSQNKPETSAMYDIAVASVTTVSGFTEAALNAGYNISETITQSMEAVADWALDAIGVPEDTRVATAPLLVGNPAYLGAVMLGETLNIIRDGGDINKIVADLETDTKALFKLELGDQYSEYSDQLNQTFEDFHSRMETLSDAAAVGEMVGNLLWKIALNVKLLNDVGRIVESGVNVLATAPGLTSFMSKVMSPSAVANTLKVIGFVGNVTAQGFIETMVDDKHLVDKAFASGEMTPELTDRIVSNIWFNTIGEGAIRGMEQILNKTVGGQLVSMKAGRTTAKLAKARDTILGRIFKKLNGIKADGSNIYDIAYGTGVAAEATGRSVEAFNIAAGYDLANVFREAIIKNPIVGEASEGFDALVKSVKDTLFPGKTLSTEEARVLEEQTAKALEESVDKAAKSSLPFKERVNANFERFRTLQIARMNLENQIDAISKGVSMEMTKINETVDAEGGYFTSFTRAESDLATVESGIKADGGSITTRGAGSFLSKEASEAISLKPQIRHYEWMLENQGKVIDGIKVAEIPANKASVIKQYIKDAQEKITSYEAKYGVAWTNAVNDYWHAAGKYNKAVTDYMINNGYVDREYADTIYRLRKMGYGADGSDYIPTSRLFSKEDIESGVKRFANDNFSDKVAIFRTRKIIGDDPELLSPGDVESSFVDPTMVIYGKMRAAATVAQAQNLGRAIQSANMITRQLKGFSNAGFSQYEINMVEKGMAALKDEFNSVLSPNGKTFADFIQKSFLETNVMRSAYDTRKLFDAAKAARKRAESAGKAYDVVIRKQVTANARDVISQSSGDELSAILAQAPDGVVVPSFDILGLNANTFKAWYDNLPDYLQTKIIKDLGDQKLNVTNVKKMARGSNVYIRNLQSEFLNHSGNYSAFKNTQAYQDYVINKLDAEFEAEGKTIFKKPREDYLKALEKQYAAEAEFEGAPKWDPKDIETLGKDFEIEVKALRKRITDKMVEKLTGTQAFDDTVETVLKNSNGAFGTGEEALAQAREYVALSQLHNLKGEKFAAPLNESIKNARSTAFKTARKGYGKEQAKHSYDIANSIGDGIKADIDSKYSELVNQLKTVGATDAIDMKSYWNEIKAEMDVIEGRGLRAPKGESRVPDFDKRKIIQLVDKDGRLSYYEADPMSAFAANAAINFNRATPDGIVKSILAVNSQTSQIFRWGTTGIDKASYINQWFRDPMDAVFVGAAKPFTNLRTGSPKSFLASLGSDSIPFGERIFGKAVTDTFTKEFIDATYESTQKSLVAQYGQEWWESFSANAVKNIAPEEAEAALRRATVTFAADTTGAARLPGQGGITEAEFYRAGGEKVTASEARREEMAIAFGAREGLGTTGGDMVEWQKASRKMQQKVDSFFRDTSRGNWRESFARRNVYAAQYRNAIEAGMTMQEAQIWATRYALDATTDFGRTFAYANRFIKSVPYLGAAINGHKSFIRLLEIDPAGVSTRFTYGLILPYMTLLTESLSDPKNREVYQTIPEYEKQDSVFLVYKGAKVQIPIPQQLSRFLAPFRQVVEKAANAQDAEWNDLIASDILGLFPLDLSGFVDLDANTIMKDDSTTGIWTRIGRGVEKAASSLMPPVVKSVYMMRSGRDPYTGRDIDTSNIYFDENGDPQIMDSTKSGLAIGLSNLSKEFGWNLSASAASKVLQSLFGRSTIGVLENMARLMQGDIKGIGETWAEEITRPIDGGSDYDKGRSDWNKAINIAYEKRKELINDEEFNKALAVIRDENWDNFNEEKRQNALRVYNNKLDEFSKSVLDIATNMRNKYPDQYTGTRVAQIVSLLTLPTGTTYNQSAYSQQLQQDTHYDARNSAISTLLRMGFPLETSGDSILGRGYYDKYGQYQFKVYTPYQIQYLQSAKYGATDQFQAMIKETLAQAKIKRSNMFGSEYRAAKASGKAARKKYESEWNTKVVKALAPIFEKYGANSVLYDSATRDYLEDYIFTSNPYKKKEYLYKIFGGKLR